MVSATSHGIEAFNAIHHAMKKRCLAMPNVARRCRMKSKKSPHLRGLRCVFVPLGASQCQTPNHSHSIVAGGLEDTSYVTRLIPRTSLMIRDDTFFSSAYGSSAQSAVMKSLVCTARKATT